jgi:hypothetical protein
MNQAARMQDLKIVVDVQGVASIVVLVAYAILSDYLNSCTVLTWQRWQKAGMLGRSELKFEPVALMLERDRQAIYIGEQTKPAVYDFN